MNGKQPIHVSTSVFIDPISIRYLNVANAIQDFACVLTFLLEERAITYGHFLFIFLHETASLFAVSVYLSVGQCYHRNRQHTMILCYK